MEYKTIDGIVYSRYALTPPIVNSQLSLKYGVQVPCPVEYGQYAGLTIGQNVKLRLVIEGGTKKMTCHAKIDWVKKESESGECMVGFGHLSLTDLEFRHLSHAFSDKADTPLEFGETVEDKAKEAKPVTASEEAVEIMRLKAVNLPVSVIEAIDEHRGSTSFSEFVIAAVRAYLKKPAK